MQPKVLEYLLLSYPKLFEVKQHYQEILIVFYPPHQQQIRGLKLFYKEHRHSLQFWLTKMTETNPYADQNLPGINQKLYFCQTFLKILQNELLPNQTIHLKNQKFLHNHQHQKYNPLIQVYPNLICHFLQSLQQIFQIILIGQDEYLQFLYEQLKLLAHPNFFVLIYTNLVCHQA